MNNEKYLPIGTVVMLKNGKKRVMVTGFAGASPETNGKMYDYIGCLYPEGVISSDKNLVFDHEQVDKIFHMGLIDEEWKTVEEKLKKIVANIPKEEKEQSVIQEEVPTFAMPTEPSLTEAVPTFAMPTEPSLTEAVPTFAMPTEPSLTEAIPTFAMPIEPSATQNTVDLFSINVDLFN